MSGVRAAHVERARRPRRPDQTEVREKLLHDVQIGRPEPDIREILYLDRWHRGLPCRGLVGEPRRNRCIGRDPITAGITPGLARRLRMSREWGPPGMVPARRWLTLITSEVRSCHSEAMTG